MENNTVFHPVLNGKKHIFFDVGFTLDYPTTGDWMFTSRFYELAGEKLAACDPEAVKAARDAGQAFFTTCHLLHTFEEETACMVSYYTIVSHRLGLGLTPTQIREIAEDRTYNMDFYHPYPGVRQVLETLRRRFTLGVISDTWPSIENQLRRVGVWDCFDSYTFSFELGVFKPDPMMYRDALKKAGVPAAETVFLDDNPDNLRGAAKQGITPILIAANPASDVEVEFTKIHSLQELLLAE